MAEWDSISGVGRPQGAAFFQCAYFLFVLTQKETKTPIAIGARLQKNGEKLPSMLVAAELAPGLHLMR